MVPRSTSTSRARVTWPVQFHTSDGSADGVIVTVNHRGAFIRCQKPLRLSESVQLTIEPPENESIHVTAEVVFSNVYGPDDHITPRGMGVLFFDISDEDRQIISKAIRQHLETNKDKIDPNQLRTLQTLVIDQKEIGSEAA
jgi:Tfp pilus assembly protein PilZ